LKQRPQPGLKPPRKPKVKLIPVCRQICISSLDCSSLLGAFAMRCSAHTARKTVVLQDTSREIAGSACLTYCFVFIKLLEQTVRTEQVHRCQNLSTRNTPTFAVTLPLIVAFGTSSWPVGKPHSLVRVLRLHCSHHWFAQSGLSTVLSTRNKLGDQVG